MIREPALAIALAIAVPAVAHAQKKWSGPQPPGGRIVSTMEDCQALQREWDQYRDAWTQQHQACLDSTKTMQAGPSCSKAPCQQLHYLVFEYGNQEGARQMDECRSIVNRIAKQKAEHEAAVRRYNEHVAEQNRRVLQAIERQNAAIAEHNRQVQEAVERRNREAQQAFQNLVREYNLRLTQQQQSAASIQQMRDLLASGGGALTRQVSSLVDELGQTSFGDILGDAADTAGTLSDIFDVASVTHDLEVPEQVGVAAERLDQFSAAYDAFRGIVSTLSSSVSAQQRFDDQMSGLSGSTGFLFRRTPWVRDIVSDNIDGIGRWGNSLSRILDDSFSGQVPSTTDIKDEFARAFFPRFMWLNDKVTQVEGASGQLFRLFGGGASQ